MRAFGDHGHHLLSVYLCLDTSARRQTACNEFVRQVQACLDNGHSPSVRRETIQEDIDIVCIYLKAHAHRCGAGLAIFSCAAELFWRTYWLPVAVPTQVSLGPEFDIKPLLQVVTPQIHGEFRSASTPRRADPFCPERGIPTGHRPLNTLIAETTFVPTLADRLSIVTR
jgi:hypothetical protein